MLDTVLPFLALYWPLLVGFTLLALTIVVVKMNWEEVRYHLMRFGTNFPLMGKLSKMARKPARIDEATGHRECDLAVANSFLHYYKAYNEGREFFEKCEDYLMKVSETHRKPKGLLLWGVIFILVAAEAAAFGMAIAPYALTLSATPNMAAITGIVLGIVLSCGLLLLSEKSGHQLYTNRMVNQLMSLAAIRRKSSSKDKAESNGVGDGSLQKSDLVNISLTYVDRDRPSYQQMLNRFDVDRNANDGLPKKGYSITIAYIVFIVFVAIAAFYVRAKTLEAQETEIVSNPMASVQMADDFPVSGSDDDFPLPSGMAKHSANAEAQSAQDRIDALHDASVITFVILSGLFVFIQIASTYLAYAYGFVGSESEKAWKNTRKFKSAAEFERYMQKKANSIAVDAQNALTHLANKIARRPYLAEGDDEAKNLPAINFKDFVRADAENEMIANTRLVFEKQIRSYTDMIQSLNSRGDWDGAKEVRAKLREALRETPPGVLSPELQRTVEMLTANYQAPEAAPAPAAPAAQAAAPEPAPAPVPAPAPQVSPAPVVAQQQPQEAPVNVASEQPAIVDAPAQAAPAEAAPAFDAYKWGDLLALEKADLPSIAADLGVPEKDLLRAFTIQQMKRGATA